MKGRFITFEGVEGSGKSTHVAQVVGRLAGTGREIVATREPGGTPLGERIRHLLKEDPAGRGMSGRTETLLFQAARAELIRGVIQPALDRGAIVICDRFVDSTLAYQGGGRELDPVAVEAACRFATGGLMPDLTVLLDVDVETSLQRMTARNDKAGIAADRIERENRSFHERVRQVYLDVAAADPGRVHRVDATQSFEIVAAEVWTLISRLL